MSPAVSSGSMWIGLPAGVLGPRYNVRLRALAEESDADSWDDDSSLDRAKLSREAAMAWLHDRTRTAEGRRLGRRLFLATARERGRIGVKTLELVRSWLSEASGEHGKHCEPIEDIAVDSVFLAMYICAAQAGAWPGADAWPTAIMTHVSVPGMGKEEVENVLLRDVDPQVILPEEVRDVVDAFVSAVWGDARSLPKSQKHGVVQQQLGDLRSMIMISASPQFVSMQYVVGVLWGFALRGLVLRLALDRSTGSVPVLPSAARARLERMFALDEPSGWQPRAGSLGGASASSREMPRPSLMSYAGEFFGHDDWAELCQPAVATLAALEAELEEAMPGVAMLAGQELDGFWEAAQAAADAHAMDDSSVPLDQMVHLTQADLEAFHRRAVALGALLADAEALVEKELGQLRRGGEPMSEWMDTLVRSGALSGIRREQVSEVAQRLHTPFRRLVEVLKKNVLGSKLRSAREALNSLYAKSKGSSSRASSI